MVRKAVGSFLFSLALVVLGTVLLVICAALIWRVNH